MIIVTGATGRLGRLIVEQLLVDMPTESIGATTRNPSKAGDLADRGVRIRHGDFAEPSTLATAFEGVTQLLIISSNAAALGGDALAQHRAAIDAAKAAGARRILYTSHMGAGASSAFPPMRDHAATEIMLHEAGVAWTALRNGFYAETISHLVGDAGTTGVIEAPEDGKVAWTAHEDLAAAAVAILKNEGRFEGPTPALNTGDALDLAEIADILSGVRGRPVTRKIITDAEHVARLSRQGLPPAIVEMSLGMFAAARAGEFADADMTLSQLIGRPATSVQAVLER